MSRQKHNYTVHLRVLDDHAFSRPVSVRCEADSAAEAETMAIQSYAGQSVDVLMVVNESSCELLNQLPSSERLNPAQYGPHDVRHLLRVAMLLDNAYIKGVYNEQMDWSDVDLAREYLQRNLPRFTEANRQGWQAENETQRARTHSLSVEEDNGAGEREWGGLPPQPFCMT